MSFDLYHIRRELHAIPEIAFGEHLTQALLLSYLRTLPKISIQTFTHSTGILIEYSHGTGDYLLFRADMDALPVSENTGCAFSSTHPGAMHACGHDIHMTILLGLIEQVTTSGIAKNLLFLFQPAEEGKGGAESILREGLIQRFPVRHAFALHVSGRLPVGTVSTRAGIFFAIPQEFDVEFRGKSAHAAFPENGCDALKAGMEFYLRMNAFADALKATQRVIFNVGVVSGGTVRNVVPDYCRLEGTHRTLNKQVWEALNSQMQQLGQEISTQSGAKFHLDFLCSYDPVVNDPALYAQFQAICAAGNIPFSESPIFMTGEDFGFFTSLYPSLLFWLGAGVSDYDLHSDKFLPDENCISSGVKVMGEIIRNLEL